MSRTGVLAWAGCTVLDMPATYASVYVRNSKMIGADNVSQEGMVADCHALADRHGLTVVATHIDNGKSGAVRDRPEFVGWLDDAKTGRADVLISWAGDRLTREGVNVAGMILDVIEGKDPVTGAVIRDPVRLLTEDDGLDSAGDDDSFRLSFVLKAEIARAERKRIVARNKATAERLKEQGRIRGAAPFGTRAGEGNVLERDPEEGALLDAVAGRLIAGESFRSVVHWLNATGSTTRRGNPWIRSSLRETLRSEAVRTLVLSTTTRRALDKVLDPKKRTAPKHAGGRPPRLLTRGRSVCGSCGRSMTTSAGRYICSSTSEGSRCPRIVSINADAADAYVGEEFARHFGHLQFMEAREIVTGEDAEELAAEDLERAEAALLADLTASALARVQEARERLRKAQEAPVERHTEYVPTGITYADHWEQSDSLVRRAILAEFTTGAITIAPTADGLPGWEYGKRGSVTEAAKRILIPWDIEHAADLEDYGGGESRGPRG